LREEEAIVMCGVFAPLVADRTQGNAVEQFGAQFRPAVSADKVMSLRELGRAADAARLPISGIHPPRPFHHFFPKGCFANPFHGLELASLLMESSRNYGMISGPRGLDKRRGKDGMIGCQANR
jgi:hypothetical protein